MVLEGCEPETQTYNVLIRHFCAVGEFERAMGLFERMGCTCAPNVDTYNVLINRLFGTGKSGNMVMAGRLLVEMVERGHAPSRVMFRRVLLLMTGNQGLAKQILSTQSVCRRLTCTIRL
ncbi:Pentatricopeptide repeat-containing protein [Acorus calamus]|uniref:Pentatricopeptide repeat-containing protein n=1 Tax=Acorus calamus TaxID=4465 RepID=A0AAV9FEK0_ACOCL|nr:Pentatricopeptide repeat-containing protein [Acorus calamus]